LTGAQYFDGRVATYNYNTSGSPTQLHALTAFTSSGGNWRYFNYDSLGRLVGTYLAGNAEALTFSYGIGGQVNVTDTLGNVTQFFYDNNGLLIKTVDANGNAVHLSFDNNYNLTSVMDPAGRTYSYGYDNQGNVTTSTDPLANQTKFSYTSSYNRLASVTDAKGNPTHYSYDPYGNLESITYADGSVEDWTYDDVGNPQTWNNRRGHQTFNTFNDNGQVTGKYFADGSETSYEYDGHGNLTNASTFDTELNQLESSSMSYDGSNRLTQITYPGGKYLNFTYDSTGRRTSSVDQLGHQLAYYYDVAGRLASMTNELNALVVAYQYDPDGRVAAKTLGNGMFTTYQYDPAGQLRNLTNFLGNGNVISRFNYTYDNRGRRITMSTLDGNWTYTYDDVEQLINAVYAAVTTNVPNQNLTYVYDSVGNRTQSIENGVTNSYTANNLNQYYSVGQTNYTFDADGNLIQEASPEGTNTYTYNDENRLTSMTSPQGNWQYTYDGLGNRTVITANGTATRDVIDPIGLGNVVGEYGSSGNLIAHYDHALGLLSRIDASANWTGYTFDGIGNVQQMVSSAGAIMNSYAYMPFGGLLRNVAAVPNPFQFNGQFGVMADNNGLNFMRARYYNAPLGRFTSQDPVGVSGESCLYAYTMNSPVTYFDPTGLVRWHQYWGGAIVAGSGVLISAGLEWTGVGVFAGAYTAAAGIEIMEQAAIDQPSQFSGGLFIDTASLWAKILGPNVISPGVVKGSEALDILSAGNGIGDALSLAHGIVNNFIDTWQSFQNLIMPTESGGSGSTVTVGTTDPNQLIGPAGYGANGFVVASSLLAYRIDFENSSNAAAPAQQVNIADQLSTNYDWTTFNVSEVGFGNLIISLPPGVTYFATNVPYSYLGTNFQVQIQIGIQPNSGEVYANFQSIDPTTSLPPPVNIGFLPPEDGTGRGMGHVTYTIHAKGGLPNGTQLNNVALISFNQQPSIATDQIDDENPAAGINPSLEASITLDSIAPTSYVLPLPAQSQLLQVPVSWTGQDNTNGPGIASYNIYVSDNGGSWTLWQSATTATNATFQGKPQHTYGFTSQAMDNAGLLEAQHTTADATTTIIANPQFQFTVTPASTNLNNDTTFSYIITVKNIGTLNLSNVTMSNAMPAGIDLDYVQYGRGSCDIEDTYLLWSLGNMNTNVSASMTVTATAGANGTWTNLFAVADSQGAASANAVQILSIGVTPPVVLNIALTNNQVLLSWPSSAGNFGLQVTTNLVSSANWSAVGNAPTTNGNTITVTIPVTKTNQFFRLENQ
jgi:RHS repeat-associated protein/uncharacterized repeat protein (TIGR01451 family)